jgi:hypothetical protein
MAVREVEHARHLVRRERDQAQQRFAERKAKRRALGPGAGEMDEC